MWIRRVRAIARPARIGRIQPISIGVLLFVVVVMAVVVVIIGEKGFLFLVGLSCAERPREAGGDGAARSPHVDAVELCSSRVFIGSLLREKKGWDVLRPLAFSLLALF
jgi:hypothetical protein